MPKTKNKTAIADLPVTDLAYAVDCLVAGGKTTTAEVLKLAAERSVRIAILEAELKVLQQGGHVAGPAADLAPRRATRRPKPAAKASAPKAKESAERVASRQLQGQYMGYLRSFAGAERDRIKGIGQGKGLAAAVAEMIKLRSAKPAARKSAAPRTVSKKPPATKRVAKAAPAKKSAPTVDPKRAAALKLQGTYIGLLRTRPDAEKAKLKALAKEKGFGAAIAVMKRAAK